jgi:hypothetical protein
MVDRMVDRPHEGRAGWSAPQGDEWIRRIAGPVALADSSQAKSGPQSRLGDRGVDDTKQRCEPFANDLELSEHGDCPEPGRQDGPLAFSRAWLSG